MKRHLYLLLISTSVCFFSGKVSGGTVNLFDYLDLQTGTVAGTWSFQNGMLKSDNTGYARVAFHYTPPPGEYDYSVDFSFLSGATGNMAQLVSYDGTPFEYSLNAGTGHYCRLEDINGHFVIDNPTLTKDTFVSGHRYTSTVRVRADRVICEIDGHVLIDYPTDYSDLSRNPAWYLPNNMNIGLGSWNGPNTFYSATLSTVPASTVPTPATWAASLCLLPAAAWASRRMRRN